MPNTDISPASAEIKAIIQELSEQTAILYDRAVKPSWNQVRVKAQAFVQGVDNLNKLEQHQKKIIRQTIKADSEITDSFVSNTLRFRDIKKAQYFVQAKYRLAFEFDDAVTAFRGQAPKTAVFVHYMKNQLSSYELPLSSLVNLMNSNQRLQDITPAMLQKEGAKQIENSEKDFPNPEHINIAHTAYIGVKNRMVRFRQVTGRWQPPMLLMWKETKWVVARINSYGDAKEAYIAAIMKQHMDGLDVLCHDSPGSAAFYNDMLIKDFFNNFIAKVDNTAAVIEEDVVTDEKQYAVKSEGAGFPKLSQYLTVAKLILKQEEPLSPEKLSSEIKNLYTAHQRNVILAKDIDKFNKNTWQELGVEKDEIRGIAKIYDVPII